MPDTCLGPLCGYVHLLSQWLKLHLLPFAPLITVMVASIAGLIAVYSIHVTRSVARKRAAIDFFLKTEMDAGMLASHLAFEEAVINLKQHLSERKSIEKFCEGGKIYKDIRTYLNVHELVAVGIKNKVFDGDVCYNYWSDALVRHTDATYKLIEHESSAEGGEASYLELRNLSEKWKKRTTKWQAKERAKRVRLTPTQTVAQSAPVAGQNPASPSPQTTAESRPEPKEPPPKAPANG
jgi:hypothetical protein